MSTMPREPRFRIVVAVLLTAAIGGMFLAGEGRRQGGAPLVSASDQRAAQDAVPPVATAPSADDILTYTGRDPFARDKDEKKSRPESPAADPLTPVAQGVTPLAPSAGVTVSVGSVASPLSGVGSTRGSPVAGPGDDDGDDPDVVVRVQPPDQPTVGDPLPLDPAPADPRLVEDGAVDGSSDGKNNWERAKDKAEKAKDKRERAKDKGEKPGNGHLPPYQAYERAKDKSWKDRGHKGQSSRPGRRVGQSRNGRRGRGNAWGWKARCDGHHPSSTQGCWR